MNQSTVLQSQNPAGRLLSTGVSAANVAGGALGVSSDAKDEPKRGAWISNEPASYDPPATHADARAGCPIKTDEARMAEFPIKEGGSDRTGVSTTKPGAVKPIPRPQGSGEHGPSQRPRAVQCKLMPAAPTGRSNHNDCNRYSFSPQTDSAEIDSANRSPSLDSQASLSRHQETGGMPLLCAHTRRSKRRPTSPPKNTPISGPDHRSARTERLFTMTISDSDLLQRILSAPIATVAKYYASCLKQNRPRRRIRQRRTWHR